MKCQACDSEINYNIDEEFCPKCYISYLENLKDIISSKDTDEEC